MLRRSPHLVVYWRDDALHIYNYATRTTINATPFVVDVLHQCARWQRADEVADAFADQSPALVGALLERLVALSILERSDRALDPRAAAMNKLGEWQPEMGFFHAATRDVTFTDRRVVRRRSRERSVRLPMPAPVKTYPRARRVAIPAPHAIGEFPDVLMARRTWRRFSSTPIDAQELATMLALTAGVQQWVEADGHRAPLKTSPSGGARHSIETYVVVREVKGMRPGVYHYASDRHALDRLRGRVPLDRIRAYMPTSPYFANASALVFFTSVFERILWRYPYSRAYRAALAEAGHVCQTFCLTATWLNLAPFCLMGLADSIIEEDLGLDGVSEAVLYAAGVGRPPRGSSWAALPTGKNPKVSPPSPRLRRHRPGS